jgi:hypothetical protein
MASVYQSTRANGASRYAGRTAASRQQLLVENASTLGLLFTAKPSREQAIALTEMAWTRDGTAKAEAAAAKCTLPWIIHGEREGRGVAVFMVNGPPGSVFATRAAVEGPVIRIFSRYNLSNWTYAFGFAAYLIVGAAASWFLASRGWTLASGLVWGPCIWLGYTGLRHLLALMGLVRLPAVKDAVPVGDGLFAKRFSVTCSEAEHARRMVTPELQQMFLNGDALGSSWWSLGQGWVSCVSRHEPINRTHGKVMSVEALQALIDLTMRVAALVEGIDPGGSHAEARTID